MYYIAIFVPGGRIPDSKWNHCCLWSNSAYSNSGKLPPGQLVPLQASSYGVFPWLRQVWISAAVHQATGGQHHPPWLFFSILSKPLAPSLWQHAGHVVLSPLHDSWCGGSRFIGAPCHCSLQVRTGTSTLTIPRVGRVAGSLGSRGGKK